ncbi:MAG: hypothetical protein ACKVP0_22040 [Pirellulaceae bacterium]
MPGFNSYHLVRRALVVTAAALLFGWFTTACTAKPPSFAEAKAIAAQHLRTLPDYAPGDLISRGDVEPIFNELLNRGLSVDDFSEDFYDDFVPDNSFLIRTLRTEAGRKFMRQVSGFPGAYDRLERLSWVPAGQELLGELIDKPDGAALFKTMTEPTGMQAIARHLAADPRGKNYALPTGHIHTASQLMKRLEAAFPTPKGQVKQPAKSRR